MKNFFSKLSAMAAFMLILFSACQKETDTNPGTLEIEFDHRWGTQTFNFNQDVVTPNGDTARFTMFKYFVSNIKLTKEDGSVYEVPNSYYLVNQDSATTRNVVLKDVPAGQYKGITFTIGVDSAMSASGLDKRTGVLDPATGAKGMYWAWNSGYIFVKLEGESPSAPLDTVSNKRRFQYHIGGYGGYSSKTINNLKTVTLVSMGENAVINATASPVAHVVVDVKEMFQNPSTLSIRANPVVMFAPYSTTIAANYHDMFRLDHIHN